MCPNHWDLVLFYLIFYVINFINNVIKGNDKQHISVLPPPPNPSCIHLCVYLQGPQLQCPLSTHIQTCAHSPLCPSVLGISFPPCSSWSHSHCGETSPYLKATHVQTTYPTRLCAFCGVCLEFHQNSHSLIFFKGARSCSVTSASLSQRTVLK